MENKTSTGYYSTGYRSTGDYSTGNYSTGNCSTGDYSTGNCSSGDWSTSSYSIGHFSTIDYSGFGAFNKPCTLEVWNNAIKPNFLYFKLTKWVNESAMTEKEKQKNPSYKATGGYIKVYDYKEAWRIAFDGASDEEIEQLKALPNFDAKVFEEISGIDITEREKHKVIIDGKELNLLKDDYLLLKGKYELP